MLYTLLSIAVLGGAIYLNNRCSGRAPAAPCPGGRRQGLVPFHGGGKGFGYLPHSNNTAEPAPFKGPVFSCPFSCVQTCVRFRPCLRPDGLYGPDIEYGLVRHD